MPDLLQEFPNFASDINKFRYQGHSDDLIKDVIAGWHLNDLAAQGKLTSQQVEAVKLAESDMNFYPILSGIKSKADGTMMGKLKAKKDPDMEVDPSYWSTAKGAVARGVDNVQGMGYGLLGLFGDAIGSEELTNAGLAGYQRNQEEAQQAGGKHVQLTDLWESEDKLNDFVHFAAGAIGENIPTMATMVMGGGIGGLLAKKLAEKAISKKAAYMVSNKITEQGLKKIASSQALGRSIGSVGAGVGMSAGGIFGNIHEKTGEKRAGVAMAHGIAAGMLDALPVVGVMKRVAPKGAGEFTEKLAEWMGSGYFHERFLKSGSLEAVTESLQTVIERMAVKYVDENQHVFTPEGIKEIINAAGAGYMAGGTMSAAFGEHKGTANNKNTTYQREDGTVVDENGNPVVQDLGNTADWSANAQETDQTSAGATANAQETAQTSAGAKTSLVNSLLESFKSFVAKANGPETQAPATSPFKPESPWRWEDTQKYLDTATIDELQNGLDGLYGPLSEDGAKQIQSRIDELEQAQYGNAAKPAPSLSQKLKDSLDNRGSGAPPLFDLARDKEVSAINQDAEAQKKSEEEQALAKKEMEAAKALSRSQRNSPATSPSPFQPSAGSQQAPASAPVSGAKSYEAMSNDELTKERIDRKIAGFNWTREKVIAALIGDDKQKAAQAKRDAKAAKRMGDKTIPTKPQGEVEQPSLKFVPPEESRMQELDEGAEFKSRAEKKYYLERRQNSANEDRAQREAPTPEKEQAIQRVREFFGIDDQRGMDITDGAEDVSPEEEHRYDLANQYQADLERAIADGDETDAAELVKKVNSEYNGTDGRSLQIHGESAPQAKTQPSGRASGAPVQGQASEGKQTLSPKSEKPAEVSQPTPPAKTAVDEAKNPSEKKATPAPAKETDNIETLSSGENKAEKKFEDMTEDEGDEGTAGAPVEPTKGPAPTSIYSGKSHEELGALASKRKMRPSSGKMGWSTKEEIISDLDAYDKAQASKGSEPMSTKTDGLASRTQGLIAKYDETKEQSILRFIGNNSKDAGQLSSVLDRLDAELGKGTMGDIGNIAYAVALNPVATAEIKQRAEAIREASFENSTEAPKAEPAPSENPTDEENPRVKMLVAAHFPRLKKLHETHYGKNREAFDEGLQDLLSGDRVYKGNPTFGKEWESLKNNVFALFLKKINAADGVSKSKAEPTPSASPAEDKDIGTKLKAELEARGLGAKDRPKGKLMWTIPDAQKAIEDYDKAKAQAEAEAKAKSKEPWEMTQDEFMLSKAKRAGGVPILNANDRNAHRNAVQMAINEGKEVPEHVLRDYPGMEAQADDAEKLNSLQTETGADNTKHELDTETGKTGTGNGSKPQPVRPNLNDKSPQGVLPETPEGVGRDEGTGELRQLQNDDEEGSGLALSRAGDGPEGGRQSGAEGDVSGPRGRRDAERRLDQAPANSGNWVYPEDKDPFPRGEKTKVRANLEAIKTIKKILAEKRPATREEQEILSKWVGWGQFPGMFNASDDKFAKEREELAGLLTKEEMRGASASTKNAHFTHPDVVRSFWKIAEKLGFNGGRFLEPSGGIGYYLGLIPDLFRGKTKMTAVELEPLTGAMLKALYPDASVSITGFENVPLPENFFRLVASNVPFGDYGVNDNKYNKFDANIHDYFFLKSLDVTQPGGVVAFITSTGTLDKQDNRIRRELFKKADLIAAIRFPGDAHKENAGTSVVTDLVILRKRMPNEALGDDSWLDIGTMPDPDGGRDIPINNYFVENPDQILGRLDRTGKMYSGGGMNVSKQTDYDKKLNSAIERIPNVMTEAKVTIAEAPKALDGVNVKIGGVHIDENGKVFVREGNALVPKKVSKDEVELLKGLLELRNIAKGMIADQTSGRDTAGEREALNRKYEAFVKKFGPLNGKKVQNTAFGDDPDYYFLTSIEKWNPKTKEASKGDIFRRDVAGKSDIKTTAETIEDAFSISMGDTGGIDLDRVSSLLAISKDEAESRLVEAGLAFRDPQDGMVEKARYLSGNVRKKLREATAALTISKAYEKNVEALRKVQPPLKSKSEITAKFGASWTPRRAIAIFAKSIGLRLNSLQINASTGVWLLDSQYSGGAQAEFGTGRVNVGEIFGAALNNSSVIVRDKVDDKTFINVAETEAAKEKIDSIREKWAEWFNNPENDAYTQEMVDYYNDNINVYADYVSDGSHLKFPGKDPLAKPRKHQIDFAWRVLQHGGGLMGHEVGVGKTMAMGLTAMELRRTGKAKKPCIACLKANVESVTREIQQLYPGAKILSTTGNFDKGNRKKITAQIATGDWDIVIMTHDHMGMLPMTPATQQRYIASELAEIDSILDDLRMKKSQDKSSNRLIKQLEKQRANIVESRAKLVTEGNKDDVVYWEETGIDFLFVDEAHHFKSLPIYSRHREVRGIPTSASQRAAMMLMRSQYLHDINGGKGGLVFATGTPITNTMAELFIVQKFLQPSSLISHGVEHFDKWSSTFAEAVTKLETTVTNENKDITRMRGWQNLRDLRKMAGDIFDIRFAKDVEGLVRPKRIDIADSSEASKAQIGFVKELANRANKLKGQKPGQSGDNHLTIYTDAKKSSVDMRLVNNSPIVEDGSGYVPKIKRAANNILKLWKEDPDSVHLAFSDMGVNKTEWGFSLYDELKALLVEGGMKPSQIVIFKSDIKDEVKADYQEMLKDGRAFVGIGGTKTLGTGVNVQNKVKSLHHIDVPMIPASIDQRDGRGIRQGNRYKEVQIFKYIDKNTSDQVLWDMIARKDAMIKGFMKGEIADTETEEDTESISPEDLAALASGDPRIAEMNVLNKEVAALRRASSVHDQSQKALPGKISSLEDSLDYYKEKLFASKQMAASFDNKPSFEIEILGQKYTDRKEAQSALDSIAEKYLSDEMRKKVIGQYRGFNFSLARSYFGGGNTLFDISDHSINSLEASARSLVKSSDKISESISRFSEDIDKMKQQVGAPFNKADEYRKKSARLKRIQDELTGKVKPGDDKIGKKRPFDKRMEPANDVGLTNRDGVKFSKPYSKVYEDEDGNVISEADMSALEREAESSGDWRKIDRFSRKPDEKKPAKEDEAPLVNDEYDPDDDIDDLPPPSDAKQAAKDLSFNSDPEEEQNYADGYFKPKPKKPTVPNFNAYKDIEGNTPDEQNYADGYFKGQKEKPVDSGAPKAPPAQPKAPPAQPKPQPSKASPEAIKEIFANLLALRQESRILRKAKILIKHGGDEFNGYYDEKTGQIVINADRIKNMDELRAIMQHEDLVHRWLEMGDPVTYNSLLLRAMKGEKVFEKQIARVKGLNENDPDVKGTYFTDGKLNKLGAEEVIAYWVQDNPMMDGGESRYWWHLTKKIAHRLKNMLPFTTPTEREVSDIMMDGFIRYVRGKGPNPTGPKGEGKKFSKESESFDRFINSFFNKEKGPSGTVVSSTTDELRATGIKADNIRISRYLLSQKVSQHDLKRDDLLGLSDLVKNPMMVHNSEHKGTRHVIITGRPIVADVEGQLAIVVDSESGLVADVVSVHSREYETMLNRVKDKPSSIRLIEMEQTKKWLSAQSKGRQQPFVRALKTLTKYGYKELIVKGDRDLSEFDEPNKGADIRYSKPVHVEVADFVKRQLPNNEWPNWVRSWLPSFAKSQAGDMSKVARHMTTLSFKAKKYGGAMLEMMNRAMDRVNHRVDIASKLQFMIQDYAGLSIEDRKAVDAVLNEGDKNNVDYTQPWYSSHKLMKGLSDAQKAALKGIRKMFDTVKEKLIMDVEAENDKLRSFLPADREPEYKEMFAAMAKAGELRAEIAVQTGHLAWSYKGDATYKATEAKIKELKGKLSVELTKMEMLKRKVEKIEASNDSFKGITDEIEKNLKYIENLRKQVGYFPRIRDNGQHLSYWNEEKGAFVREVFEDNQSDAGDKALNARIAELEAKGIVSVKALGADFQKLESDRLNGKLSEAEYKKQKEELRKQSYKSERVTPAPEDLFRSKASDSVLTMMHTAMKEAKVEDKHLSVADDIIRTMFYSRGWRKHLLARQGELVIGYKSEDLHEVLNSFIHGFAGITSKAEAARHYYQILQSVDPLKQAEIYGNLVDVMRDELRNADATDKISNLLNGVVYHTYLGFRASTALINATQNFLLGVPALGSHLRSAQLEKHKQMGNSAGFELKAAKDFAVAMKHAGFYMRAKSKAKGGPVASVSGMKAEEVRFLDMEYDRIMKSNLTREMTETLQASNSKLGKVVGKLSEWSSWMFSKAEQMNRLSAMLVYQRYFAEGKTDAMDLEALRRPAELFVQDVHFSYEKWNQLDMFKTPTMRLAKPFLFALASYNQNLYQNLINMDGRSKLAFGVALLLMAGIPFEDWWEDELMDNFDSHSHKLLGDGFVGKTARMGVPGAIGANLSGSIAMNWPPIFRAFFDIAGSDEDGPMQGLISNLWEVAKNPTDFKTLEKHFPMLAVKSALQAYGEYEDGLTSRTGKPLLFDGKVVKRDGWDAAGKALGLNTSHIADIKSEKWRDKELSDKWNDRKDELVERYAKLPFMERARMQKEITAYNREVMDMQKKFGKDFTAKPITGKTIADETRKYQKVK